MHQNNDFFILANRQNIDQKIRWAELLCKSYQNSRVTIRLFSTQPWHKPAAINPHIDIIHHPSNRPMEPHLMILQHGQQQQKNRINYLAQQPQNVGFEYTQGPERCCQKITQHGQLIGWSIDLDQFVAWYQQDTEAINDLRSIILTLQS